MTNDGAIDHEFYLGDEAAQADHEKEMAEMGGMTHDEPEGIAVKPGESKELTYQFDKAGQTLAGCHVVGHYGAAFVAKRMQPKLWASVKRPTLSSSGWFRRTSGSR